MPLSPEDFVVKALNEAKKYQPLDGRDCEKGYAVRMHPRMIDVLNFDDFSISGIYEKIELPDGFVELDVRCDFPIKVDAASPPSNALYDLRDMFRYSQPVGILDCKQPYIGGGRIVIVSVDLENEIISDVVRSYTYGTKNIWPSFRTFLDDSETLRGLSYRDALERFFKNLYAANQALICG